MMTGDSLSLSFKSCFNSAAGFSNERIYETTSLISSSLMPATNIDVIGVPSRPNVMVSRIMASLAAARKPALFKDGAIMGKSRFREKVTPVPMPPLPASPWQCAQYFANSCSPFLLLPSTEALFSTGAGLSDQPLTCFTMALTCASLNFSNAGMILPGRPCRIVFFRYSSGTLFRKEGSAIGTPTPPLPSLPWHDAQCLAYSSSPCGALYTFKLNAIIKIETSIFMREVSY